MSIDTKGVTQIMPQLGNYNVAKEVISKNGEAQKNDNKTNEDIGLKTKDVKKSVVKTDDLAKILEEVNDALKTLDVKRGYRVDKDLNRTIVSIIDTETDDIIKQIPQEDAIRLAKNINEIIGLFYDDRV